MPAHREVRAGQRHGEPHLRTQLRRPLRKQLRLPLPPPLRGGRHHGLVLGQQTMGGRVGGRVEFSRKRVA
eukprot:6504433-Pyramimonas_sp.AAC.1